MVQIIDGVIQTEDITKNAMGGTELIAHAMVKYINPELLKGVQIVHSRVRDLDFSKKRILVLHDLHNDPENKHLASGGYNKFDKIVFVSNWQMQNFINMYSIPWYKCAVIKNAIVPLKKREKIDGKVKLIYHTTPHRGLSILLSVFDSMLQNNPDIDLTLDVYSSFKIYGWDDRDNDFKNLFDFCENHDKINYYGSVSNEEVKDAISKADIFAYPSIWPETSGISLIEAMSAGLLCVHPNYAALYETAANWTNMYQFESAERGHAKAFAAQLDSAIKVLNDGLVETTLKNQSIYTDMFYSWETRKYQWEHLLRSL